MKQAFYCNIPCTILADLSDKTGDVVIEVETAMIGFNGGYQEPDYSEPVLSTLIVHSRYVTDKKIDVEGEIRKKHDEMEAEIRKSRDEANRAIKEERRALELSIQDLRNRAKKFSAMEQMLLYLEGDMNWIVKYADYRFKVENIQYLRKEDTDGWGRGKGQYTLQAIIFRDDTSWSKKDECRMEVLHSEYVDGSGSKYTMRGFKTEEEAVSWAHAWILGQISKGESIDLDWVEFADKYKIEIKGFQEWKDERARKAEESRQKEIEKKEQELKLLKEGKSCLKIPKTPWSQK